jgi:hypothetical protein
MTHHFLVVHPLARAGATTLDADREADVALCSAA